jgi:ATP-dependent helicase/nuclease subunit A
MGDRASGTGRRERGQRLMSTADQNARQRFAGELDWNFSVIASAGSGKTEAITDRVFQIAKSGRALEWLPQLVVVTYTNRAADQMQQRARRQILEAGLSLDVIESFNRAFFGTIHSFCLRLLVAYGHHLGLPTNLELVTDEDELWNGFVQQYNTIGRSLGEANRAALLRLVQVRHLMQVARRTDFDYSSTLPQDGCPDTNFSEIYSAAARGSRAPKMKEELRQWEERWRQTDEFVGLPVCTSGSKEFIQVWSKAFRPLREWVNACALCVAAEVQRDYREFRLARGFVTFPDQVALATQLMQQPDVATRVRKKNYRVILDEAQDTDPHQFSVLLEIARPPDAIGAWWEERSLSAGPRRGHFCMVGDFQQSIYRDPAALAHYRRLHEALVQSGAAEAVKFAVTFRLDRAELDFVNATFGEILNNKGGQVAFVTLEPRTEVLPGQVIRFDFGCDVDPHLSESQRAILEARELADWLAKTSFKNLRAQSWKDVAILCPRKAWLRPLRDALLDVDLPVEVHSETDREGESPAYAWVTALLEIVANPNASYEIAGVLREIFGLSDDELHRFSKGYGSRFQIGARTSRRGSVADELNRLVRIRKASTEQPLFTAVHGIVRTTQLRERLRSLPAKELGDLNSELDRLLAAAASAEAQGLSLSDFARQLCASFHATRETNPSSEDAIQLITAHKAKGSEWQAVIVPFLTRKVGTVSPRYPYLVKNPDTGVPQILFDWTDFDEAKEMLDQSERQEMERLLYVALTRAKHTLVLAYDRDFFLTAKGQVPSESQIKWLRADSGECNFEPLTSLANDARECSETTHRQRTIPREHVCNNLGPREVGWLDNARQRAARFIQTVSPSKFALPEHTAPDESTDVWMEVEPELRPTRTENPATRYGVWWHEFIKQIPWEREATSWEAVFEAIQVNSPNVARSRREWRLLREQISKLLDFPSGFADGAPTIHAELPFFWRMNENRCLEGIIDLALFHPAEKRWFVLDWKTNQIARNKIDILRAQYLPQIAAYWKAVTEMAKQRVGAGIYSTATGQFIVYDRDELAREWKRLRTLSQDELAAEIKE